MHLLLLDNFDSFTYNLADYFLQAGARCTVKRSNTPVKTLLRLKFDAIVISPGPGTPQTAGCTMDLIDKTAGKIPLAGICLGHQALGLYYGAQVNKAAAPVHGKVCPVTTAGTDIYAGLPLRFGVVRYHSLLLENLPACLVATAHTDAGEIMGMRHASLPVWGLQYHPEAALTEHGLQITANLLHNLKRGV